MIDFNAIKISLQEWIVRSTSLLDSTVVFNDQASPRPDKPYISMKIISNVDIGQGLARGSIDSNGDASFVGTKEFTLSIQHYGVDSMNTLSTLKDSLDDDAELQTLRDNNLIFVEQLLFTDITALLETEWEERAQLDLLFRATSTSNHQVGIIERAMLKGTYKNADGSVAVTNNFIVTDPDAIAGQILDVDGITINIVIDEVTLI